MEDATPSNHRGRRVRVAPWRVVVGGTRVRLVPSVGEPLPEPETPDAPRVGVLVTAREAWIVDLDLDGFAKTRAARPRVGPTAAREVLPLRLARQSPAEVV